MRVVYFDNSATTKPYDEVVNHICDISINTYGNPSSMHTMGIEAERLLKQARSRIASALKTDSKDIIFTSGGTESDNIAIRGFLSANPRNGRHIITTKIEHPAVYEVFRYLESLEYKVDYLDVHTDGKIDIEQFERLVSQETSLVSIVFVNNEVGTIQPVEEISKKLKMKNPKAVLHVDAVQAFGKMEIFPNKMGIDLLSVSSHKIHGPKGVGALYVKKGLKLNPIIFGGGQESGFRSGTENLPGISGFGLATEITVSKLKENYKKVFEIKDRFLYKLNQSGLEYSINSPKDSLPYILNIGFPWVKSEVLLHHLEERGIYVSTGSACSSRKNIHSHVLKAMGIDTKYIDGAIRFSFSSMNELEEVDYAMDALKEIIPVINYKRGGKR